MSATKPVYTFRLSDAVISLLREVAPDDRTAALHVLVALGADRLGLPVQPLVTSGELGAVLGTMLTHEARAAVLDLLARNTGVSHVYYTAPTAPPTNIDEEVNPFDIGMEV